MKDKPQRTTGAFRALLWTITRNKLRDHFRRVARTPDTAGGSTTLNLMQQVMDAVSIPDEELTGDFQLQQLTSRALAQVQSEFESRTWQAFWPSVVDGIGTAGVAQGLKSQNPSSGSPGAASCVASGSSWAM